MSVVALIAVPATAGLAVWGVVIYNLLVRDRARVAAAWSDVEVQLKRRHDLIPKLVEAVKQHAGYERGVLESVAQRRAQALAASGPAAKGVPEASLGRGLQRLIAVAENYPELKASGSFLDLQRNLSDTEDQIQYARRYYNGAVNNLNTRVDTFPDLLVARLLGFRHAEYFELDNAEEAQPAEVR
jgi:LemA protein